MLGNATILLQHESPQAQEEAEQLQQKRQAHDFGVDKLQAQHLIQGLWSLWSWSCMAWSCTLRKFLSYFVVYAEAVYHCINLQQFDWYYNMILIALHKDTHPHKHTQDVRARFYTRFEALSGQAGLRLLFRQGKSEKQCLSPLSRNWTVDRWEGAFVFNVKGGFPKPWETLGRMWQFFFLAFCTCETGILSDISGDMIGPINLVEACLADSTGWAT